MHDQPEATEEEQGKDRERHREEEAMRGADDEEAQIERADDEEDSSA